MLGTVIEIGPKWSFIQSPAWPFRIMAHRTKVRRGPLALGVFVRFDPSWRKGRLVARNVDRFLDEGDPDGERD
jgi:hypothetical protein